MADPKEVMDDETHLSVELNAALAQVARLEGEVKKQERARSLIEEANAAMAAALREQGTTGGFAPLGEWHAYGCGMLAGPGVGCLTRCKQARAALSPDAGKGKPWQRGAAGRRWLPPEEQVQQDFDRWQDEHMAAGPGKIPACLGPGCPGCKLAKEKLAAALDALKGVE